jgi:hypothetical protein
MRNAPSRIGNMDDRDWQTDAAEVRARVEALRATTPSAHA